MGADWSYFTRDPRVFPGTAAIRQLVEASSSTTATSLPPSDGQEDACTPLSSHDSSESAFQGDLSASDVSVSAGDLARSDVSGSTSDHTRPTRTDSSEASSSSVQLTLEAMPSSLTATLLPPSDRQGDACTPQSSQDSSESRPPGNLSASADVSLPADELAPGNEVSGRAADRLPSSSSSSSSSSRAPSPADDTPSAAEYDASATGQGSSRGPQILSFSIAETSSTDFCSCSSSTDNLSDASSFVTCGSSSAAGSDTAGEDVPPSHCPFTDDDELYPGQEVVAVAGRAKKASRDWVPKTALEFLQCLWRHVERNGMANVRRAGQPSALIVGLPRSREEVTRCLDLSLRQWAMYYPARCQPFAVIDNPKNNGSLEKAANLALYFQKACLLKGGPGCSCNNYFQSTTTCFSEEEPIRCSITGIPETNEDFEVCEKALTIPNIRVSLSPKKVKFNLVKRGKPAGVCPHQHPSKTSSGSSEDSSPPCSTDGGADELPPKAEVPQKEGSTRKPEDYQKEDNNNDQNTDDLQNKSHASKAEGTCKCVQKADQEQKAITNTDVGGAELDKKSVKKTEPNDERPMKTDLDKVSTKKGENLSLDCNKNVQCVKGSPATENTEENTSGTGEKKYNMRKVKVEPLEQQYLDYSRSKKVNKPKAADPVQLPGANPVKAAAADPTKVAAAAPNTDHAAMATPARLAMAAPAGNFAKVAMVDPVEASTTANPTEVMTADSARAAVADAACTAAGTTTGVAAPKLAQATEATPVAEVAAAATPAKVAARATPAKATREDAAAEASPRFAAVRRPLDLDALNDQLAKLHAGFHSTNHK